jgi:hypothetical protein
MYKSLIQYHSFPKNFVLVIDDSLRYENHGIDLMLSESRKFLKILAVAQRRLKNVDFITELYLENYNPVRI